MKRGGPFQEAPQ